MQILKITAFYKNSFMPSKNLKDVFQSNCCSIEDNSCMFRSCSKCQLKKAFTVGNDDLNKPITYFQWVRKSEKREIKGENKIVNFLTREAQKGLLKDLISEYNRQEA